MCSSDLEDGVRVFHAGTGTPPLQSNTGLRRLFANDLPGSSNDTELLLSGNVQTAGGRVLTVVANAPTLTQARDLVYRNVA